MPDDEDGPVCGYDDTKTTDRPCQYPVDDPDDRCYMHAEDGGIPEGHGSGDSPQGVKDPTASSTDGGAPAGNKNAMTHGLSAAQNDPAGLLDWMEENDPDAYEWVERKFSSYLERAPFSADSALADHLLQVVMYERAAWEAHGIQVRGNILVERKEGSGGTVFEQLDENPVNLPVDRIRRTTIRSLKELGVIPGPKVDAEQAAATRDLGEAVRRLAEQGDDDIIDVSPPGDGGE